MFDQKQKKIINASVLVFSAKGYTAATIADLAHEAGVGEATIYNHFKNKEEILLSIPILFFTDFFTICKDHLTGVKDPKERFRKFIWLYLWWSRKNEDFVRVFLFEIEPHPKYHLSTAYDLVGRLYGIPAEILKTGQEAGVFRKKASLDLIGYFTLGTMHYLFFTRILFERGFEVLDDFDDLAGLMSSAVIVKGRSAQDIELSDNKKDRILLAAEKLFSTKNYWDAKIAEIARLAKVADGTIYDYFENKEDLLFSLFERRMDEFTDAFRETLRPSKAENKLKHVILHFLTWAKDNREWVRIFFKDILPNPRFYLSDKYESMLPYDAELRDIFFEGLEQGVFKSNLNMYFFRAMILGTMDHLCSPWAMRRREKDLLGALDGFHDLVFHAVRRES